MNFEITLEYTHISCWFRSRDDTERILFVVDYPMMFAAAVVAAVADAVTVAAAAAIVFSASCSIVDYLQICALFTWHTIDSIHSPESRTAYS